MFPVEAGHVLMFNRAVGAPDGLPAVGDPAPPTFTLASAQFDGSTLRFKMVAQPGRTSAQMPTMVMTRAGEKVRGLLDESCG